MTSKIMSGKHVNPPAVPYSSRLIWKRSRKVRKITAGIDGKTMDAEVHRLRIRCKELCDLMEIFAPVFSKQPFKGVMRPLKQLQDSLGLFNDAFVQQDGPNALRDDLTGDGTSYETAQSIQDHSGPVAACSERKTVVKADGGLHTDRTTRL